MTNASLLIVPDRFKASKLYSQLPQDGSGDFVVTRATTAFRTNENGILESVASGVPRLDFPIGSGCPALLVEPAATNLLLRSEEFNDASWLSADTTVTANAETSPSGALTADTITVSTSDSAVRQVTALGAGTYTFSVFVKLTAQTTAGLMRLQAQVDGSNVSVNFTPTTQWQRVTATYTAVTGITLARIRGLSFVGTLAIWGAQLETGSVATSYIPTVAATATRNADVISKTAVSGLIGQTEGTIYAEFNVSAIGAEGYVIRVGTTSFNNTIYIFRSVTNTVGVAVRSNGASTFLPASFNAGLGVVKVAVAYANADFAFYVNGAQRATGAAALSFTESLAAINLGAFASNTAVINDRIRAAALYTTRLSNAQLQSLTTL